VIRATIVSASKAILDFSFASSEEIKKFENSAKYRNKSIEFQYKRHLKNRRWPSYDPEGWKAHGEMLKSKIENSVMFYENGQPCIRPGYLPYLQNEFNLEIINNINYPKPRPYPWYRRMDMVPYEYQSASIEKLIEIKHGNVELCTGAGKSLIILMIAQKLGLKTVVMVPSASIFSEMVERFEHYLGPSSIGVAGDGRKKFGKNFMICISDTLTNLKEGTKEYEEIASAQVLLADESHTIPAETLESVCHGVLKDIPYRFFLSGTQTRGDGTEKLLKAIIGKTVYKLSTEDAIRGGYICDHSFKIIPVESSNPTFYSQDALEMKRMHFLNNANIAAFTAKLANAVAETRNESTLILIDELPQILLLAPLLKVPYALATSADDKLNIVSAVLGLDKTKIKRSMKTKPDLLEKLINSMTYEQRKIYDEIKNSDPIEAVEKFNKGEVKVLIGTSCISTGTNIYPTHHTVNWQGGTSEIRTKQGAVGRSVRKLELSKFAEFHPPKKKAIIYDFNIKGIDSMFRHLKIRVNFYKSSGTMIEWIGGLDPIKEKNEEEEEYFE
jgi:superfamily II DNA or RNA helicase